MKRTSGIEHSAAEAISQALDEFLLGPAKALRLDESPIALVKAEGVSRGNPAIGAIPCEFLEHRPCVEIEDQVVEEPVEASVEMRRRDGRA